MGAQVAARASMLRRTYSSVSGSGSVASTASTNGSLAATSSAIRRRRSIFLAPPHCAARRPPGRSMACRRRKSSPWSAIQWNTALEKIASTGSSSFSSVRSATCARSTGRRTAVTFATIEAEPSTAITLPRGRRSTSIEVARPLPQPASSTVSPPSADSTPDLPAGPLVDSATRDWDASSYHRVSIPHEEWAASILERLPLDGGETVLDAGCGSGRATSMLVDRLPRGRVIAVDGSASMVAKVTAVLRPVDRAQVADLTELKLDEPVDAIFSSAVFHWIADHGLLFRRLHAMLRPGGLLAAQCGGSIWVLKWR